MSAGVSSQPFHALAASLKESSFAAHGTRLDEVLWGTWTTSSELVGELGTVVIEIRRECRPLDATQKSLVKECLIEVRKVWPGFGRFSCLPFHR